MNESITFNGKLIVLTAPSGGGKTTIKRHLLKTYDELGFSMKLTALITILKQLKNFKN